VGHPPYGHAGEDALNDCLREQGGFSHNCYALTIAEHLEVRYLRFPGLNLTAEVLESQRSRIDKHDGQVPLLEAQVVDLADSISYDAHDTDDAVKLGLVALDELAKTALIGDMIRRVRRRHGVLEPRLLRKAVVHELIDRQVSVVLQQSADLLAQYELASAAEARRRGVRLGIGTELAEQKKELEQFLYNHVYRHPRLVVVRSQAQQRLRALFEKLSDQPDLLPAKFRARADETGLGRAVGEFLAGMTDRYCEQQFLRHFGGNSAGFERAD
jgi:dGTPase